MRFFCKRYSLESGSLFWVCWAHSGQIDDKFVADLRQICGQVSFARVHWLILTE
jgi:hypothetical protein